jgi:hypothetical protein
MTVVSDTSPINYLVLIEIQVIRSWGRVWKIDLPTGARAKMR